MFWRRSEEERLFRIIDEVDSEITLSRLLGHPISVMEEVADALKTSSYSFKGIAAKTGAEVAKCRDPAILERWEMMWTQMEAATLHPREVFELYKVLTGRKKLD
jgi:hypothetical protein